MVKGRDFYIWPPNTQEHISMSSAHQDAPRRTGTRRDAPRCAETRRDAPARARRRPDVQGQPHSFRELTDTCQLPQIVENRAHKYYACSCVKCLVIGINIFLRRKHPSWQSTAPLPRTQRKEESRPCLTNGYTRAHMVQSTMLRIHRGCFRLAGHQKALMIGDSRVHKAK